MTKEDQENHKLRERDLYAWSRQTEALLSQHRLHEIDWDSVAVELERSAEINDSMPMSEAVETLLTHLAIWNVRPDYHTAQRRAQIESARFKLEEILSRSPSLVQNLDAQWKDLYARARFAAMLIVADPRIACDLATSSVAEVIRAEFEANSATKRSLSVVMYSDGEGYNPDEDHYAWCREQAAAARARRLIELDAMGIAEEVSNVGASVRRAATESVARLIGSLTAWKIGRRTHLLKKKIAADRSLARAILWKNPSLALESELVDDAYNLLDRQNACRAASEAVASRRQHPLTLAQMLDDAFLME